MRQLEAAVTQRQQLGSALFPREEVGKKQLRHIAAQDAAPGSEWVGLVLDASESQGEGTQGLADDRQHDPQFLP
jgi:hypothetical protein